MNRHLFLAVLLLAIIFHGNAAAQIAPILPTLHGPESVKALVRSWGQGRIQTKRPTVLFATSIRQCAGCCAASINALTRNIRGYGLDANTLVVVAADAKGEGLVLRDQFLADAVAEDVEGKLENVLHADAQFPDMYVIDPEGRLIRRIQDIQHNGNLQYADFIAAGLQPGPSATSAVTSRSRSIEEPKGKLLVDIESCYLDRHGMLFFIEGHHNVLYQYNAATGRIARGITVDSMKFRFRDPADTSFLWAMADSVYRRMVALTSVVHASADSLFAFAEFFTGFTLDSSNNRKRFMMKKNTALLSIHDGIVRDARLLPVMPYILLGRPTLIGESIIATPCVAEAWLDSLPVSLDSLFAFLLIDTRTMTYSTVASLGAIRNDYGRELTPVYIGHIAPAMDSGFIYASESNRMLFGASLRTRGAHTRLQPSGTLLQLLSSPRRSDSVRPANLTEADVSKHVTLLDITSDSNSFYVLLEDKRNSDPRERMVVQRYQFDGALLSEYRVRARNDELVAAHLAGVEHGELVALVKWKKARWTIERIPGPKQKRQSPG